mmetsp:Transcript_100557/g.307308  ORF Transcript_100557/g.307308 Transcript_100557/m.307308 type:complete len:320 (-) Transcript_100557:47-1006(-)
MYTVNPGSPVRSPPSKPSKPSQPFDCNAGFATWQTGWSAAKRTWCCANGGKGCTSPVPPAPLPMLAVPGSCLIWGDPHIETFDHGRADFFGEGEVWLVRSKNISIQARYEATPFTHGLAATGAVAVGGPFIRRHVLKVSSMHGGVISWDDEPILPRLGTSFNASGFGEIRYDGEGKLVDSAQEHLEKHIVHVDLPGVHMQVVRWSHHVNVRITMLPAQGGQDGHCGNFNGNPIDDDMGSLEARVPGVTQYDTLFKKYMPWSVGPRHTLADCQGDKRAQAVALCQKSFGANADTKGPAFNSCIFDTCFGGAQYAQQDAEY